MDLYGLIFGSEKWDFLCPSLPPTQIVELFDFYTNAVVDQVFPEESVHIFQNDKPYFNDKLRILKRQRCREYSKNGKSAKYKQYCLKFSETLKSEIKKYQIKMDSFLKEGKIGSIYPFLRKLGNGPLDVKNKPFVIPCHEELSMSPYERAENIALHFASISQEFPAIDKSRFSGCLPRIHKCNLFVIIFLYYRSMK